VIDHGGFGWTLRLAVLSLMLGTSGAAHADEVPVDQVVAPPEEAPAPTASDTALAEARERIGTGEQLFEMGNFNAALAEFERAGTLLEGHPMHYLVLYNIGQCYEQLFQYGRAMSYYQRYLDEGGADAEDAGEVRGKIQVLRSLLGTITVTVNTEHFVVWIDGQRVGEDETEFMVPGGTHQVEVRATGFEVERQEVQLPARETRALTFELAALAEEYEGTSPVLFYGSVGVAGAALVGGVALGIVARAARNRVDAANAAGGAQAITIATQAERDRIRGLSIGADVLFGSALLFGATALILGFTTNFGGDEEDEEEAASASRPRLYFDGTVARGGFDLRLGGSF
jgi:tetratricopeptide (TPR) repeat protein